MQAFFDKFTFPKGEGFWGGIIMYRTNAWEHYSAEERARLYAFADAYRAYLDSAKTEREAASEAERICRDAGFPCLALGSVTEESLCTLIDEAAHLDGESLSAAARRLRERERANGRAASALLALSTPDEMSGSE